jgi:hypothetical protein
MTEQVLNGFEIHYPAPTAIFLSWVKTDPRVAENEKEAEQIEHTINAVKEGYNEYNEYILMQGFGISVDHHTIRRRVRKGQIQT